MTMFAFEASLAELEADLDSFVDALFSTLESEFLVMARGEGFVEYPAFESAYEKLKRRSRGFREFDPQHVLGIALETSLVLVVLRTMLGFTPSEWAYLASVQSGLKISQGYARHVDRSIRVNPEKRFTATNARLEALVRSACGLLRERAPKVAPDQIHRLDKADTRDGLVSIRHLATLGAPYPMVLYERLLGRPFAAHRDSVSELVGGGLEVAIERELTTRGVSYRKTARAERIPGFDQAPDFIVPDEFTPKVVIEAKITEDDGTARDKITRVQHLDELSRRNRRAGDRRFEVIACIAGRGFGVRREDMKKLLLATGGKVFTWKTLDHLVSCSGLNAFCPAPGDDSSVICDKQPVELIRLIGLYVIHPRLFLSQWTHCSLRHIWAQGGLMAGWT